MSKIKLSAVIGLLLLIDRAYACKMMEETNAPIFLIAKEASYFSYIKVKKTTELVQSNGDGFEVTEFAAEKNFKGSTQNIVRILTSTFKDQPDTPTLHNCAYAFKFKKDNQYLISLDFPYPSALIPVKNVFEASQIYDRAANDAGKSDYILRNPLNYRRVSSKDFQKICNFERPCKARKIYSFLTDNYPALYALEDKNTAKELYLFFSSPSVVNAITDASFGEDISKTILILSLAHHEEFARLNSQAKKPKLSTLLRKIIYDLKIKVLVDDRDMTNTIF